MLHDKYSIDNPGELYSSEMDDDSMLADSLIPNSRIVGLIDELDMPTRFAEYVEDEDSSYAIDPLDFKYDDIPDDE